MNTEGKQFTPGRKSEDAETRDSHSYQFAMSKIK